MDASLSRPDRGKNRVFPRLQVLGVVGGQVMPLNAPLTLIDLTQGGFSVRSATSFPPGARHQFRFGTTSDHELTIEAISVHCCLTYVDADGHVAYVSGLEFASTPSNDKAVAALIARLSPAFALS